MARNKFFKENNKNLLDDTIYREFQIECMGNCVSGNQQYRLDLHFNKKNKKRRGFFYVPGVDKFSASSIKLQNISGNKKL
jgi:hypothetical protein